MSLFGRLFRSSKREEPPAELVRAREVAATLDARPRGEVTALERATLTAALTTLEAAGEYEAAHRVATALGDEEAEARALAALGRIEELERLLTQRSERERRGAEARSLLRDAEVFVALGRRVEARRALAQVVAVTPGGGEPHDALAALTKRWLEPPGFSLAADQGTLRLVFKDEATLGRDADVIVRGGSVSRTHAKVSKAQGTWFVEDMASRHGTRVGGFPIGGRYPIEGVVEVELGEDAAATLTCADADCLSIEITRGADRGARARVGSALRLGKSARLDFELAAPRIRAVEASSFGDLDGKPCAEATLLEGDRLTIDGVLYTVCR